MECIIESIIKYIEEDVIQENTYNKMPMIEICMIKHAHNKKYN